MKPSIRQRLRYQFDDLMSRGTPGMISVLFVLALTVVFTAGFILVTTGFVQQGGDSLSLGEAIWESLVRVLDPGTMGGDTGTGFRAIALFVTLGGIFINSALVAILVVAVQGQIEHLRRGRSQVLEGDHTIILGWSPQIFTILNQLMIANKDNQNARIVILADRDKVEMEDEIRDHLETIGSTRIIVRSGNPEDINDIEITSPNSSRSIIILPVENSRSDNFVIKTALSITNNPNRRPEPYHLTTYIQDSINLEVLNSTGTEDKIDAIYLGNFKENIMALSSLQAGLSNIYIDLLSFGSGDEIRFISEPSLIGKRFSDTLGFYKDTVVIGIRSEDQQVRVIPPLNTRLTPGDQLITISKSEKPIKSTGSSTNFIQADSIKRKRSFVKSTPQNFIILGWNSRGERIVNLIDRYTTPESTITIVSENAPDLDKINNLRSYSELENSKVYSVQGDPSRKNVLEGLGITESEHIIVLSDSNLNPDDADSKTIVTLLHLRKISAKQKYGFIIVSEINSAKNQEIAKTANVNDFVISEDILTTTLVKLSQEASLIDVSNELFSPNGPKIKIKPVTDYVYTQESLNFYTIIEAARQKNELAIGYIVQRQNPDLKQSSEIYLNPDKSEFVRLSAKDEIVVLSPRRKR